MPNPYLPRWEYIPDGEPRVFGDRVYIYGSHDRVGCERFCDYILKVWSAPLDNLNHWTCNGVSFRTKSENGEPCDAPWTTNELFAPDVVENNGKYYLYAYIVGAKGCVAVSDKPEGPFTLLSRYKYNIEKHYDNGTFIDPGVLVDDDGRVYVYCGYQGSYMAEIDGRDMFTVIDGSYKLDIIPKEGDSGFFEAASPRKVGDTYYLIYSPNIGSRLDYATSDSPTGPFKYRGTIIDNGIDFPGGNDHGSICCINGQYYIFYHRMTNGTIMSRRGCVEKIELLPDGTIPQVEMTSLGFENSLTPYEPIDADIACVLKNGCFITELNPFTRVVAGIKNGAVLGWKYFDFGEDYGSKAMEICLNTQGTGCSSTVRVMLDSENGEELGRVTVGADGGICSAALKAVTGRHAVFLAVEHSYKDWAATMFEGRELFRLVSLLFRK